MRVVFVHGACVKDGSWWWHRTAELLAERDVASEAPALPSCGETGEPTSAQGPGLAEDVAAVRGMLTASDEPTVVVAHSYGGIVTAEAAAGGEAGRQLVLASRDLPGVGQRPPPLGRDAAGAAPAGRRRAALARAAGAPGAEGRERRAAGAVGAGVRGRAIGANARGPRRGGARGSGGAPDLTPTARGRRGAALDGLLA